MTTAEIRDFRAHLRRMRRMLTGVLTEECCESPLTLAQCDVILEMESEKRVTLSWLAERLGLDNSTLSRTVDALVEKGVILREPDPEDRRYNVLTLTADGRHRCNEINAIGDRSANAMIERIPADFRPSAVRGFSAVVDAIEAECDEECGSSAGGDGR